MIIPIIKSNANNNRLFLDLKLARSVSLHANLKNIGVFHTGSARGSAQIPSRAQAEPSVWTSCSSDQKFQACTENLSWTLFTLKAQLRISSGSAQTFLSWALSRASVKCPIMSQDLTILTLLSQTYNRIVTFWTGQSIRAGLPLLCNICYIATVCTSQGPVSLGKYWWRKHT